MNTDYITTEEAAAELGVTSTRIRAMIRAGRLKAKKTGEGNRATYSILRADLTAVRERKPGRPIGMKMRKSDTPTKKRGKAAPK